MVLKGRTTVYNQITSDEKLALVNRDNIELMNDFLEYLASIDRAKTTINGYKNDLLIFWCWNLDFNNNKYFVNLTKREISKFQNHVINEWGWSPKRIRRVKSTMSSMSNYIENILDDEIENFRPIINKIESPVNEVVREKTILTEEQVDFLLNTLLKENKIQQACAVALAAFCGCRKAEITRFKADYFKDENIIFDSLYRTPEKIRTKGRGNKVGKLLTKYITIDFKKYFELWMDKRKELGIDNEWLFVTKENDKWVQIKISTLDSYADTCTRVLQLPFYFHCMRHQLCTKLVSKYHLPAKIIQEFFGWSSQDMIGIYDDSEAVDDFGKYFTKDGILKVEQKGLSDL